MGIKSLAQTARAVGKMGFLSKIRGNNAVLVDAKGRRIEAKKEESEEEVDEELKQEEKKGAAAGKTPQRRNFSRNKVIEDKSSSEGLALKRN